MSEPISYIIGPLPFCVPFANPGETGPGGHFPLELDSLEHLCRWIWKIKSWTLTISNLTNEFQTFGDYTMQVPNHARNHGSPDALTAIICDYGFLWSHEFQVNDQDGDPATFEVRIEGFTGARRGSTGARWYPRFNVALDMLFGAGSPVNRENVTSTFDGPDIAGTLEVDEIPTVLYTGYSSQLFDSWSADITLSPSAFHVTD